MSEETKTPAVDPEFLNELKGNFNALLYLITESIALNVKVTEVLAEKELLSEEEIADIFSVTGDKERLTAIYQEVFQRFVTYYGAVQNTIKAGTEGMPPVATTVETTASAAPAENSANPTDTEQYPQGHLFPEEDHNPATDPVNQPENIR